MNRIEAIESALRAGLSPAHLQINDDSAAHAGHAGAASGGGHFSAIIVAQAFEGKSLVQRHQMVFRALGDLMRAEIHAFSMQPFTPTEYQQKVKA